MWIETRAGETLLLVVFIAAAAIFGFVVVPAGASGFATAGISPRSLLYAVAIAVAGLCAVRLAILWIRGEDLSESELNEHLADSEGRDYRRIVLIFAAALFYSYLLIDMTGFYIASAVFMLAMVLLLGERRPLVALLSPPLLSAGLFLLFERGFQIRLPKGPLTEAWLGI